MCADLVLGHNNCDELRNLLSIYEKFFQRHKTKLDNIDIQKI